jgi:hypothetical protein
MTRVNGSKVTVLNGSAAGEGLTLITGGAGFVGANLARRLLSE